MWMYLGDGLGEDRDQKGVGRVSGTYAGSTLLQSDSEQLLGKRAANSVKESGLALRADGIDRAEGKAEKSIIVGVLSEGAGNRGSSLNSLRGRRNTPDRNLIGIDNTAGTTAISIGDAPGSV